jgi:hypothetical protein
MANSLIPSVAPVTRRVRAFAAPVDRAAAQPTIFDASGIASFNVDAPPAPWIDLGWCRNFTRKSGTRTQPLLTGAPGIGTAQVRTEVEATVSLEFEAWGKLQMALSAGVQQMNVLYAQPGAAANGSGGTAIAAVPLNAGSTASALNIGATASSFSVGDIVAVDIDYTGQTGFVGSGVSGGYVKAAASIGSDVDYVRRITLNVARVASIAAGVLTLSAPLLAGAPATGMQVSRVAAFCDREGGSFFQEFSALFALAGEQGDCVLFHYPRLQATTGPAESYEALTRTAPLERMRLAANFRALPVKDANDGEMVLSFRTYLPAAMRTI